VTAGHHRIEAASSDAIVVADRQDIEGNSWLLSVEGVSTGRHNQSMATQELKPEGTGGVALRPVHPDGKGLNGFLLDWYRSEPRGVVAKPERQVLAEYFTSMLVLSAHFKYKPAPGVPNYLYLVDGEWMLSLIAPEQWTEARRQGFVGTGMLHHDMTWTLEPAEDLAERVHVIDAIARFYDAFAETLDSDLTLEEILPFYVGRMPYWQRLYANALSRSVRGTMILGDQRSKPAREWQAALPRNNMALLAAGKAEDASVAGS
jgi:hypothetical protein